MIFVPSFLVPRCLYSYVEVRLTRRMSDGLIGMRGGRGWGFGEEIQSMCNIRSVKM